jgi:class 3 adenylate cyclase/tetratricopeptide (TPR) repeat protein
MAKDAQPSIGAPDTYTPEHLAQKILNSKAALEGERKQVTVLFADLKGSMELLADRDPEEARKLLDPVLEHMMEAVHHYEGTVNQAAGDGIMALFGAPLAHEDHAVRACYAALRMQERVKRHAGGVFHTHGVKLQIRVGLNSGEVVVGTIGSDLRMDYTAVGRTTHLAARMEQLANPGSILITPSTLALAEGFVAAKPLGPVPVKGLADALEVYELTGLGLAKTRFQAAAQRGLVRFVGRDIELARLERTLERAAAGDSCMVGVVAEAGVGKSRLCFEFAERCRARGVPVLISRAVPQSRATPYVPVINALKVYCGIMPDDASEQARAKAYRRLAKIDFGFEGAVPLLFDFLGIAEPGSEPPRLDPATRRERLHGMFRPLIRASALHRRGSGPGVMLLEDLHWLDPGSESLLEVFIDALQDTKTLLIVNYRPGYIAPWIGSVDYDQISLTPLRPLEADTLAARLLGGDQSVTPLLPLIADRARGNPLFIEELVRKFEESGYLSGERGAYRLVRTPEMQLIPDNVQAIIGARIDSRPEKERSVLQAASVIGREFNSDILARLVVGLTENLHSVLQRLSSANLVHEDGANEGVFAFTHPMVQEVAYRSLLSERRRNLHALIASELEKSFPEPNGAQASLIAYHWEEAGSAIQAVDYNTKAAAWYGTGDLAPAMEWDRVRDPARALDAWKRVHRLLAGLPREHRVRQQLFIACGRIVNFGWRERLPAADLKPYFAEALEIARSLGDARAILLVSVAYGRALASSGSANDYLALADQTLSMFDSPEHASHAVLMTVVRCHAYELVGDLRAALADNDYALANLHKVDERDAQALSYNAPTWIKRLRGRILAMMGRYDEARSLLEELIASGEATVNVGQRIRAHLTMMNVAFGLGDQVLAAEHSAGARRLAYSNELPYFEGLSHICTGLERSLRGDYPKAMAMFGNALRIVRDSKSGLEGEAAILCHLAHVQLRAGLFDTARATAEEAADVARRYGRRIWLTYAEWVLGGPTSPDFRKLIKETGAEHLLRLRYPRH